MLYLHNNRTADAAALTVDAETYNLLRFAHIVLFAYWLGADLGVFLGAGWMSRPGITVPERNRIRALVMDIDLAPRLALVLMLPVGFSLSLAWGAPLPAAVIPVLWLVAAFWIAVLVWLHLAHGKPAVRLVLRADLVVRIGVMFGMALLGQRALVAAPGDVADGTPNWLALKFFLFAGIIFVGIVLRWVSGQWKPAIDRFAAGDVDGGELLLRIRRRKGIAAALSMWALVAGAALVGILKPF